MEDDIDPQVESIVNEITRIRLENSRKEEAATNQKGETPGDTTAASRMKRAKEQADKAIVQAEQFKASIIPPRGKEVDEIDRSRIIFDDDDDFFHTTCHIDETIEEKAYKGKFVELPKLLQKPEHLSVDSNEMTLVYKDGFARWEKPSDKDTKITNVKKWEKAFRIYAQLYCKANPHRSAEILQYIDVINMAAQSFSWSNVARYDYIFRHLMDKRPWRSWAKTYTQMWTMTLIEPVNRSNMIQSGSKNNHNSHGSSEKSWKDGCCWKFNKKQCSYGKNCRFEHRCTYCGSYNHPYSKCPKRNKSSGKGG